MSKHAVIVSAARTPIGSFNGALSQIPAPELGAITISEALARAAISPEEVDQVLMGCVLTAGMGQAPARQAAIKAGLPTSVATTTIGKVCGSSLKSVMIAADTILAGNANVIVAGGMENMSLAPHLLERSRQGLRLGDGKMVDSMIKDGLWDVYNDFHMGNAAELCASRYKISRKDQDHFAELSYKRALMAQKEGFFDEEIVPVPVPQRRGNPIQVNRDEEPERGNFDKFPQLKPAFQDDGTVTAANASSINDGAAALVIVSEERAKELDVEPLAKIIAQTEVGHPPEWFTTAPISAINNLLNKTHHTTSDIDLFEINEAFAVVCLSNTAELGLDKDKVNVNGGAVALGHPIGASGARILTTLLYAMKRTHAKRGIASICIGGGEAAALMVEA